MYLKDGTHWYMFSPCITSLAGSLSKIAGEPKWHLLFVPSDSAPETNQEVSFQSHYMYSQLFAVSLCIYSNAFMSFFLQFTCIITFVYSAQCCSYLYTTQLLGSSACTHTRLNSWLTSFSCPSQDSKSSVVHITYLYSTLHLYHRAIKITFIFCTCEAIPNFCLGYLKQVTSIFLKLHHIGSIWEHFESS